MSDRAPDSPLHAGEIALQRRAGVEARIGAIARQVIRDHMPDQHREFFALLPSVLLGARNAQGHPVATMLAGAPGFMHSPDPRQLHIELPASDEDPVLAVLKPHAQVGVLGLQPHTRRRNRMNGTVRSLEAGVLQIDVDLSFGNCPKYIQARDARAETITAVQAAQAMPGGPSLADALRTRVLRADTFFIASAAPVGRHGTPRTHGVDVSHRGGRPGFVHCVDDAGRTVLTVPDYPGNHLFNTLGNLQLDPRCGLLFVDYDDGGLLHIAGRAELIWDGPVVATLPGAQRALRIVIERSLWRPGAVALRWTAPVYSPVLPA